MHSTLFLGYLAHRQLPTYRQLSWIGTIFLLIKIFQQYTRVKFYNPSLNERFVSSSKAPSQIKKVHTM